MEKRKKLAEQIAATKQELDIKENEEDPNKLMQQKLNEEVQKLEAEEQKLIDETQKAEDEVKLAKQIKRDQEETYVEEITE